jgi:DNA-binding transcriptional ArsR family regulator
VVPVLVVSRAVSCPTRLYILQLVGEDGCSVVEVSRSAGVAPSTAHYHLRVLEHAGLVERHKRGRERVYRWGPHRLSLAWETVKRRDPSGIPDRQ